MTEQYNREVATHYRFYRPPLHQMILGRVLSSGESFSDCADFLEITAGHEQVSLEVSATEFAHILLSNSRRYEEFARKYGASDPFPALTNELGTTRKKHMLEANIYFSKYQIDTE